MVLERSPVPVALSGGLFTGAKSESLQNVKRDYQSFMPSVSAGLIGKTIRGLRKTANILFITPTYESSRSKLDYPQNKMRANA